MLQTGNLDHLAASLVFGGVWVLTRRLRLSMRRSARLDLIALIVGCTLYALMGAYLMRLVLAEGLEASIGAYAGLLACVNTVMARAITVPSTPRRTLHRKHRRDGAAGAGDSRRESRTASGW